MLYMFKMLTQGKLQRLLLIKRFKYKKNKDGEI